MATYAAKSGGQNFTDTWAVVDATSENSASGAQSSYSWAGTTYTASSSFTPGAITVDGIAVWVTHTSYAYKSDYKDFGSNKFYVRLATGGSAVAGTECYIEAADLIRSASMTSSYEYRPAYDYFNYSKMLGGWFFFKFSSPVTLAAATAYTLDVKAGTANTVMMGVSSGTNYLRYLRTTSTGTPGANDRMIVCGDISPTGTTTTVTVTHDSTSTATTYGKFEVGAWGEWVFPSNASTAYYYKTNADMRIMPNGALKIGTSASPLPSTSSVTFDFQTTGIGWFIANRGSKIAIYNTTKTSRAYLTADMSTTGATSATVTATQGSSVDPAWKNGDEVIFSSSYTSGTPDSRWNFWDIRTLSADSSSGTLTLGSGTTNTHHTTSPWVANVTRTIKFIGKDASSNSLTPVFFTDDIDCNGVQFYNLDYIYMHNYDGSARTRFNNCSFGKVNTNRFFATYGIQNFDFSDCVFHQTGGFLLDSYQTNMWPEDFANYGEFNNCLFIAQTWQPGYAMVTNYNLTNSGGSDWSRFKGCVFTSCQYPFTYLKRNSIDEVILKDCTFDVNYSFPTILGSYNYSLQETENYGSGKTIIEGCTFLHVVNVEVHNVVFNNCTIIKRYTSNTYFIQTNYYAYQQYRYDKVNKNRPIVFNNCTLSHLGASKASKPVYSVATHVVFNGGTIDCVGGAGDIWAVEMSEVVFNDVAWPNCNLTTSAVLPSMSYGNFIRFNKFNQVADDHRLYTADGGVFTDSSTYDTAPRSMKVVSSNPSMGFEARALKIPTKANTSTTISFKVKPSGNSGGYPGDLSAYSAWAGQIPTIVIKKAPHLGANFANDQEIFANPADFNGSTGTYAPTDLGSNLRLWLSSKDPADITYDSGGRVSQWNDKSGGNRHLTQSDLSKSPIYRINSRPNTIGVSFTHKKDQGLLINSDITNNKVDQYTTAFVYRKTPGLFDNTGNFGQIFTTINNTSGKYVGLGYSQGTLGFGYLFSTQTSYQAVGNSGNYGGIYVIVVVHDQPNFPSGTTSGTQYNATFNGVWGNGLGSFYNPYATDTNFIPNFGTPTAFSLGCGFGSSSTRVLHSPNIELLEFLYVNKVMSTSEVADLNKYLCNRYNVAFGLPTASTAWKTLSYTIPTPTKDCVIEAGIKFKNASYNGGGRGTGYLNVDTLTAT